MLPAAAENLLGPALTAMRLFAIGASWGGTRSLVAPMNVEVDRVVTPWPEKGTILRISIGLEDPDELWDDLATLFRALEPALAKSDAPAHAAASEAVA